MKKNCGWDGRHSSTLMDTSRGDTASKMDELERQAWTWLRRLQSGDVRPWDARAFRRWLKSSPAHAAAFRAAREDWALMRPAAGDLLRSDLETAATYERLHERGRMRRRVFLGAAAGAAAATVAMLHPPAGLWPSPAEWGADYRTATGEQRRVALGDDVSVTLNTRTSVRRRQERGLAGMELIAGEAAVDLGQDAAFVVTAGSGRSVAVGARFEVRNLYGKVCVTCLEGAVRVEHPSGMRLLAARRQAVYDDMSLGASTPIDPSILSAWRKGRLVFEQTPLAQVVDEINRYRPGRVVLMNDTAARQPVSGSFDIAMLDLALSQLERTFDLHARALPAGLYVLS